MDDIESEEVDLKEINEILNRRDAEYENNKKKTPFANGIIAGGIVTFIIMCILLEKNIMENNVFNNIKMGLIIIGWTAILYIYQKKIKANEKYRDIVTFDIMRDIFKNCSYSSAGFIDDSLYYESDLFRKKEETVYTGSDYIEYKKMEVTIVLSFLKVKYNIRNKYRRKYETQFKGNLFINIFEKQLDYKKIMIELKKCLNLENIKSELYKKYDIKMSISIVDNLIYIAYQIEREMFKGKLFGDNKTKFLTDSILLKKMAEINNIIVEETCKIIG